MSDIVWILALLVISVGVTVFLMSRFYRRDAGGQELFTRSLLELQGHFDQLKASMNEQILDLSRRMNDQLRENNRFLQETSQGYYDSVGKVQHRLGELHQATQSMLEIGKDISSLQDILRAPKLRGGIGELFLEELLKQILPEDHFAIQYGFRNGTKVDAAIFLGQGMIPVDAKFPLENFKRILEAPDEDTAVAAKKEFVRDVKKHIDAIASKYILPEEGTFDFALMYIPAENIYYETIIKDEFQTESITSYAQKKRVIPVSPNSFYAYLQAIVRGLKGLRIERSAQIILESLGQLETDFKKCLQDFDKLGDHLKNAQSAYERTGKRFDKVQHKLSAIEGQHSRPLVSEPVNESS